MLLQSLLLIVTLALIGSALLTSTLVCAKSAFHAAVMRESRSALDDATASFISWAQNNVKQNGIDQLPVWAATPPVFGPQAVCGENRPAPSSEPSVGCKFYRKISWNVTGYTDVNVAPPSPLTSEAYNLATAQNERRLSATLNVAINDPSGSIVYAQQSSEITVRVFHAFPYVAVTSARASTSEARSIASAEGDTAGYTKQDNSLIAVSGKPDPALPASYTNTVLLTTVDCANTANNSSITSTLDSNHVVFAPLRSFGNLAWAYEVPCKPTQQINPATAPAGYQSSTNNHYSSTATANESWLKRDRNSSSFPR